MTPTAPVLEARALHRFFRVGDQETQALAGVSLALEPGELVALAGPSGAGKSTLLDCLAGLDHPDGGSVIVSGAAFSARPERVRCRIRARHVGVLMQSGNLVEHLTVIQNVAFAQQLGARPPSRHPAELLDALGLTTRLGAYPSRLSGGEAARAGLAVALANDPTILLADEPTGELDTATEGQVLDLLRYAASRGTAILVASHARAVAEAADRTITLLDGHVVTTAS